MEYKVLKLMEIERAPVCRGDSVDSDLAHCSPMKRDDCSDDVFVDGTGISRQGDNNIPNYSSYLVEVQ